MKTRCTVNMHARNENMKYDSVMNSNPTNFELV